MESMIDKKTMSFKKKVVIKFVIFLVLHIAGLLFFFFYANAQTSAQSAQSVAQDQQQAQQSSAVYQLGVSPPTAYLKIQPGLSAMHAVTLTNTSNRPVTVLPNLVSFTPDGVTGNPTLLDELHFPYIDLDRTELNPITVQPEQTYQFPIYITVASDAPEEEHYMTVLFQQQAAQNEAGASSIGGVIGSNLIVLITNAETVTPQFAVADWQTARFFDSLGTVQVAPIVSNQSHAAQVASGSAKISGPFGATLAEYTVFPDIILGQSSRRLRWLLDSENSALDSDAIQADTPEFLKYLRYKQAVFFGPYTVELTLYSNIDGSIQMNVYEHTVIALPFSILIAAFVAGAAVWIYRRTSRTQR
ncbi:MAG: hypothetical protein WDZ94_04295 [Patescibacteria group bacterium]